MATAALELVRSTQAAASLLEPQRLQMLERLAEPDSAAGLARRMGLARQQVNYHLRELEKEGLVSFVAERRKGNCVERLVRATARSYVISPEVLGRLGATPEERRDRFSVSYLVAVAARAIRDLAVLAARAASAGKRLATLTLEAEVRFASAADRNAFSEELATELARLSAKYHTESGSSGRLFRFFVGAYPAITRQEPDSGEPVRLE
jgi:DNA-binding transcriptional ArsR family regulator